MRTNAVRVENFAENPEPLDPFRMYMKEISKHPVLTKEEEKSITERIRAFGDKEAEHKLVVANLRLVVKIAMDYHSYHLNILDLIQEGNVGLLRAVKKFDPQREIRFSTYSSFWIRAYILKYMMDSWSVVKVGTKDSQRKLFFSLNKEKGRLEREGIDPTSARLAQHFDVSVQDVEDMQTRLNYGDISMEQPLYSDGEDTFMDTLGTDQDIEENLAEKETTEILNRKILEFKSLLNDKERFILENRIIAEKPVTLREIGERFNTSRESIRHLQIKVSKQLARI